MMIVGDAVRPEQGGPGGAGQPAVTAEEPARVTHDQLAVRITRRDSTVVVEVAGHLLTAGFDALRHLLADLTEGQGNLFVAIEVGDDEELDPVLLAAVGEARAASPHCQLSVLAAPRSVAPCSAQPPPG